MDSNSYIIDQTISALTVTMSIGRLISSVSVTPASDTVGEVTSHLIKFTTPVPLITGYQVSINKYV